MSNPTTPFSLLAEFSNNRWTLKVVWDLYTENGIFEHQEYVLTFRKAIKRWKKFEDLLLFVKLNYAEFEHLKISTPFELTLVSV